MSRKVVYESYAILGVVQLAAGSSTSVAMSSFGWASEVAIAR